MDLVILRLLALDAYLDLVSSKANAWKNVVWENIANLPHTAVLATETFVRLATKLLRALGAFQATILGLILRQSLYSVSKHARAHSIATIMVHAKTTLLDAKS